DEAGAGGSEGRVEETGVGHAAVLQRLQPWAVGGGAVGRGGALGLAGREQPHGRNLLGRRPAYNETATAPGAQTERRGAAQAGECSAWRRGLTGQFSSDPRGLTALSRNGAF